LTDLSLSDAKFIVDRLVPIDDVTLFFLVLLLTD